MRVFLLLLPKSHPVFAPWKGAENVLQIYAAVKIRGWDYTWICLKQTSYQGSHSEVLSAENLGPTAEFNLLGNNTSSKYTLYILMTVS